MKARHHVRAGLLLLATGLGNVVAGQSSQPVRTESDTGSDTLAEVVVTAQKREQNLQKIAVSVTAVSSEALASRAITDPQDLQGLVPGVQLQPTFNLLAYIRGVGNYDLQPGVDPSVAYNVDGIYISHQYALPTVMLDLDRVEVLRGPQGTLYGKNSAGGTINFVTNKPGTDFGGDASLEVGNYGLVTAEGAVNLPLSNQFDLRVAASKTKHDGYLSNGFMDGNNTGARVSLAGRLTDTLRALLVVDHFEKDEKGDSDSRCPKGTDVTLFPGCAGVPWRPFSGLPGQGTDPTVNLAVPNLYRIANTGAYGQIDWDLDSMTLTYVPSFRYVDYRDVETYTPFFGYGPSARNHLTSQELRLASSKDSAVDWVTGLYYSDERSRDHVDVLGTGGANVDGVSNSFDLFSYKSTTAAIFGQAVAPLVERLRLIVGARYSDDKKETVGQAAAYCQNPAGLPSATCPSTFPEAPALVVAPTGDVQEHRGATWKGGLEFDLTPTSMAYVNASTGFKAGGVNQVPVGGTTPPTYGPETIKAVQLGSKNRFLDGRLQLNAEIFHYDYRGYQTLGIIVLPGNILSFVTLNSQTAEFYGGEIEANYLLTRNDRIDFSVSQLTARFRTFDVPSAGIDVSGYQVPNAPTYMTTVGYQHDFQLSGGGNVTAHVENHVTGPQWVDLAHGSGSHQEAYSRTDADLTYHSPADVWTLGLWARNLENYGAISGYLATVGASGSETLAIMLPPRTFGIRAKYRF